MNLETSPASAQAVPGAGLPPRLTGRLVLGACLGVLVIAACLAFGDVRRVGERMAGFDGWMAVAALGLALGNYVIRFLRWQLYLRRLDIGVPRGESALVFGAGFVMAVSPGKVGELLKAWLLRESRGTPIARSAPIVVAERVTDLIALLLLGLVGLHAFRIGGRLVLAGIALIIAGLLCISSRRLSLAVLHGFGRLPLVRRVAHKIEEFYDSMAVLLAPGPLLWGTLLGAAAWMCECLGFWLIIRGFRGAAAPLPLATFIYAITTIGGALSFLPGGLGVTEGSMAALLESSARGLDRAGATAATLVTRFCTLWFAVGLGVVALLVLRRHRAGVASASG